MQKQAVTMRASIVFSIFHANTNNLNRSQFVHMTRWQHNLINQVSKHIQMHVQCSHASLGACSGSAQLSTDKCQVPYMFIPYVVATGMLHGSIHISNLGGTEGRAYFLQHAGPAFCNNALL